MVEWWFGGLEEGSLVEIAKKTIPPYDHSTILPFFCFYRIISGQGTKLL